MRYAYDRRLGKWVILLDDVVFQIFDTELECLEYIKAEVESE